MSTSTRSTETVPNIGPQARRVRLLSGLVGFGIALVVVVVLITTGSSRWWRLLLFLPLLLGFLGVFQARGKT